MFGEGVKRRKGGKNRRDDLRCQETFKNLLSLLLLLPPSFASSGFDPRWVNFRINISCLSRCGAAPSLKIFRRSPPHERGFLPVRISTLAVSIQKSASPPLFNVMYGM